MRTRPDEHGLALIILLVVVLAASLLGAAMANIVLDEIEMGQNDNNLVRAQYFAEGGLAAGWNQLANVNASWTGPLNYTYSALGANNGAYQVQVDTAGTVSNTAVKVLVAQGNSTFALTGNNANSNIFPAVAQIRETGLLLPTAFTYAVFSNTSLWVASGANGASIQNLIGPRPNAIGTLFANDIATASSTLQCVGHSGVVLCLTGNGFTGLSIQGGPPATTANASLAVVDANSAPTCSQQGGTCVPLTPASDANVVAIAMPQMNWTNGVNSYQGKAQTAGTNFASALAFYQYVCNKAGAASAVTIGTAAAPVILFVNDSQVLLDAPTFSADVPGCNVNNLTINGTLAVYTVTNPPPAGNNGGLPAGETCRAGPPLTPCGDLEFENMTVTVNAQKGEPAIMVAGSIFGSTPGSFPGPQCNAPTGAVAGQAGVTIKGLVYALANTADPTNAASPATYGWCVGAGAAGSVNAVQVNGALVANAVYEYMGTNIVWDPSIFYQGLPSGLINPGAGKWTVILLSHSTGQ